MNPSTALGRVLVDELVRCGVQEAVLAPGSRSAPLALALQAADAAGRLRLHVRVDERSAAYCALGLAKAAGRPVVVVTTSGTAAANVHPAVLEASESGVPLVVLTADRPPELRAAGANQTVDQVKLYGSAVRLFHEVGVPQAQPGQVAYWRALVCRAVAAAAGVRSLDPGPVHLNLALREPLVDDGDDRWPERLDGRSDGSPWTAVAGRAPGLPPAAGEPQGSTDRRTWPERTLILVGDAPRELGGSVRLLSEANGWPVVSEASGNAREGSYALRCGHLLLSDPSFVDACRPDRVLVVGRPTLHRGAVALLRRDDIPFEVVAPTGRWPDQTRSAANVRADLPRPPAHPGPRAGRAWLQRWLDADRELSRAVDALLDDPLLDKAPAEPAVARDLVAALPPGSLLVAGSSLPVRDLCVAVPRTGVTVLANRGAAGIDGTVSTAIGAALAWQRAGGGPAFALLGDLTFVHDANGLLIGPGEPRPDLTFVVVNNDGGGIFGLLEQGDALGEGGYERVFGTPTGADLAALCGTSGTPHTRVSTVAELVSAALDPRAGMQVVEVRTDRMAARDLAAAVRVAVADTVRAALAGVTGPG
jgi:2-succinyl-5-enolpyruvyl-6-hydroxy-3-cyclohexene-1-carboxylate synthase